MGKSLKAKKRAASLEVLASTSCPLVEFVFDEPLIQVACHPEQPIVVCAIATGHVFCCKYDAVALKRILNKKESALSKEQDKADQKRKKFWKVVKLSPNMSEIEPEEDEEKAPVEILWKTRRHKGSVRGLCFNGDGSELYTIGIDRVLKKADSMSGKVVKKVTLPLEEEKNQYTKLVKSQTHPFLLLGDERGNIYTLNSETLKVQSTIKSIHNGDAINDIFQFVGKSVYKFISLGQTTLAFWDSRESNESDADIPDDDLEAKRKVYTSDDQEDEMICGTFVNPDDGDVLVCGMGEGVLTVWKPKKNDLVDQVTRIPICKNESIDCIISSYQDDNCVYCGCSNGNVYKVNVKLGKVVEIRKHSSLDEVYFIDLDHEYRILSAGMDKLKLWDLPSDEGDSEKLSNGQLSDAEDDSESFSDSDSDSDADSDSGSDSASDSDEGQEPDSESSSEEETSDVEETLIGLSKEELLTELDKDLQSSDEDSELQKKRAKKPQPKNSKKQKKELNNKQLRNLQTHEHGIKKFEGL